MVSPGILFSFHGVIKPTTGLILFLFDCSSPGCHDITVGTSFATPVVSGVVALLLEVNPDLGWRDVRGILASTSQKLNPDDPSWTMNAAGFNHCTSLTMAYSAFLSCHTKLINTGSMFLLYATHLIAFQAERYGFGVVDAEAVVEAGRSWQNWGPERHITASANVNLTIVDDIESVTSTTIVIEEGSDMFIEAVAVYLGKSISCLVKVDVLGYFLAAASHF